MSRSIARWVEPAVEWLAGFIVRRWLLIANGMLLVFFGLPFLAPLLEAAGLHFLARIIFIVYRPTCHQLPDRSFFIAGHQAAICARCSAIYIAFWAVGMFYALRSAVLPRRAPVWTAPPLWTIGLAAIPMGIDGLTQLLGFRVSTNVLRTLTGALAGAAAAAVIYPYMHTGFRQARQVWETKSSRRSEPGRQVEDEPVGGPDLPGTLG